MLSLPLLIGRRHPCGHVPIIKAASSASILKALLLSSGTFTTLGIAFVTLRCHCQSRTSFLIRDHLQFVSISIVVATWTTNVAWWCPLKSFMTAHSLTVFLHKKLCEDIRIPIHFSIVYYAKNKYYYSYFNKLCH